MYLRKLSIGQESKLADLASKHKQHDFRALVPDYCGILPPRALHTFPTTTCVVLAQHPSSLPFMEILFQSNYTVSIPGPGVKLLMQSHPVNTSPPVAHSDWFNVGPGARLVQSEEILRLFSNAGNAGA